MICGIGIERRSLAVIVQHHVRFNEIPRIGHVALIIKFISRPDCLCLCANLHCNQGYDAQYRSSKFHGVSVLAMRNLEKMYGKNNGLYYAFLCNPYWLHCIPSYVQSMLWRFCGMYSDDYRCYVKRRFSDLGESSFYSLLTDNQWRSSYRRGLILLSNCPPKLCLEAASAHLYFESGWLSRSWQKICVRFLLTPQRHPRPFPL